MKKRLIALSITLIMLLQILATPIYAIGQEIEDAKENSQEEVTEEQEEIIENVEEETIVDSTIVGSPAVGSPQEEAVEIKDDELRAAILARLVYLGIIEYDEQESHEITVSDMESLDELAAYYVYDLTGLEYAINLTCLELADYSSETFDLNIISGMTKLTNFSIGNYAKYGSSLHTIQNMRILNTLPKLKIAEIDYENQNYIHNNISELKKIDRNDLVLVINQYYEAYGTELQTIIDDLSTLKVLRVIYDPMLNSVQCTVPLGKGNSVPISLENISPIFHDYILNEESVFYRPITGVMDEDSNLETYYDAETGEVTVTITTHNDDDYGEYNAYFNLSYYFYYIDEENSAGGSTEINLKYKVAVIPDDIYEINILDENLEEQLLDGYDIDYDGTITSFDMVNIFYLRVFGVEDFTGLENAVNLEQLMIDGDTTLTRFNFATVGNMNKLRYLELRNIKELSNINVLNSLNSIENVNLSFNDPQAIAEFTNLADSNQFIVYIGLQNNWDDDELVYEIAKFLDNRNAELPCTARNLYFNDLYKNIEVGDPIIIGSQLGPMDYTDYPIFGEFVMNPNSKFYNEYFEPYTSYGSRVIFDNDKKTLTIKSDKEDQPSEVTEAVYYLDKFGNSRSFDITYTLIPEGDYDTKVDVSPDLRDYLFRNDYDIDHDGEFSVAEMENITYMSLYNIYDFTGLEHATKLRSLYINNNQDDFYFDCLLLKDMTELETVEFANLSGISNCDVFDDLDNLIYVDMGFVRVNGIINSAAEIKKINRPDDLLLLIEAYSADSDERIDEAATSIKDTNVKSIMFENLYRQSFIQRQIRIGTQEQFTFDEVNPFLSKYIFNEASVFHIENTEFIPSRADRLSIDVENKIITISAVNDVEPGNAYEWFRYSFDKGDAQYNREFAISYFVALEGDHDNELDIPDRELYTFLKNNFDKDNNEKITEYDMINIEDINIYNVKDIKGLEYAKNLRTLSINGYDGSVSNLGVISELNKLESLYLFNFRNIDFSMFNSMNSLRTISASGVNTISNVSSLNSMNALEYLELSFITASEISKLSALTDKDNFGVTIRLEQEDYSVPVTNEQISDAVQYIETLNVKNVVFGNIIQSIDLGYINIGETVTVEFDEISPWINYMETTQESKLYQPQIRMAMNLYDGRDITLDNEERKITIVTDEYHTGDQEIRLETTYEITDTRSYINSFSITYKVMAIGDKNKEIHVYDENLRNLLIQEHNYDGVDMISEFDMYNIEDLEIDDKVSDLRGLESAINLRNLRIADGSISDFSPISSLEKLNSLQISNDLTENVDYGVLQSIPNLNWLNISIKAPFDMNSLRDMQHLRSLNINATQIYNLPTLNTLAELRNIYISANEIDKFEGLGDLSIQGNGTSLNISIFNYNNEEPYTEEQYNAFLNSLAKVEANSIVVTFSRLIVDLGEIEVTENPIVINYDDLNPVLKALTEDGPLHKNNILLNPTDRYYWQNNNEDVRVDAENKQVIISPSNPGNSLICLQLGMEDYYNYDGNGIEISTPIVIKYNAKFAGSKTDLVDIPDENLRKYLEENFNIDGEEGISEYDMANISEIYLYGFHNLQGLENARNLKKLFIDVYEDTDLSIIQQLPKLEELEIGICDSNVDLTPITTMQSIKSLRLSFYGNPEEKYEVNNIISNMPFLEKLAVQFTTSTLTGISNLTNLKELEIYMPEDNNIDDIFNKEEIERIELYNIKTKLDYNKFNSLPKLNELSLVFVNAESMTGLNGGLEVIDYTKYFTNIRFSTEDYITNEEEQIILNEVNKTSNKYNFYVSLNISKDLGNIIKGTQKEYETYGEFDAILGETLNQNSRIYNLNPVPYNVNILQIDKTNHKITVIAGNEVGNKYTSLYLSGNNFYCNMYFEFRVITDEGDTDKLYTFKDPALQYVLEEKYNIDEKPGFSERDMLNLTNIDLEGTDVEDLSGLEDAVNLKEIYAPYCKIKSIEPIIELENLEYVDLSGNLITDVTCLANNKFTKVVELFLDENFIDFTDESENLKVFKEQNNKIDDRVIPYMVASQKHGNPDEFDNEVVFGDARITEKLIEAGAYTNEQGKITRRTLFESTIERGPEGAKLKRLNLDNMNITDLSGFEYLGMLQELILSNNQITNIEPLKYLVNIKDLDLSHNNISDLSPLSSYIGSTSYGDRTLDYRLAFNNITSIAPLNNWEILTRTNSSYYGYTETYRCVSIDLAENNITSIEGVENWKNLEWLDLASNEIEEIGNLEKYNFTVWPEAQYYWEDDSWVEQLNRFRGIQLIDNKIDFEAEGTEKARSTFNKKGVQLILDGDGPEPPQFTVGDVDGNGVVNATDYTMIVRYLKGYEELTPVQQLSADVDKNGTVNATDYAKLVRYLKGYESLD